MCGVRDLATIPEVTKRVSEELKISDLQAAFRATYELRLLFLFCLITKRSRPISRVLSWATIHLGCTSPCTSSGLPGSSRGPRDAACAACFPIWPCSRWGLPCHRRYRRRGALLPHPFTLAVTRNACLGGLLSVALSVGSRPPGVTWRLALWSPDFPLLSTGKQRLPGRLPRSQ